MNITACVRSVHTSSSYDKKPPSDLLAALLELPTNIVNLKSSSSHHPHWVQQTTQQTQSKQRRSIMSLRTAVQQKYAGKKSVKIISSSYVKCKRSGPTLCAICDSSDRFNFAIRGFNGSVDGLFRIAKFVCKQQAWESVSGHPITLACTQPYITIAIINIVASEKTVAC